jgi:hypothetical protein
LWFSRCRGRGGRRWTVSTSSIIFSSSSASALIAIVGARPFAPRWSLAVLLLLGAYLSLAGGATTAIAAFSVCAAQLAAGSRRGVREWAAVIAVGAVAALLVGDIPVHPDHVI